MKLYFDELTHPASIAVTVYRIRIVEVSGRHLIIIDRRNGNAVSVGPYDDLEWNRYYTHSASDLNIEHEMRYCDDLRRYMPRRCAAVQCEDFQTSFELLS